MWSPNFGHPLLNFLAWVIVILLTLLVIWWVIGLLRDLFGNDPVAYVDTMVRMAVGTMDGGGRCIVGYNC